MRPYNPIAQLKTKITQIHNVRSGETVGYNCGWRAKKTLVLLYYLLDMPTVTRGNMVMVKAGFWLTEKGQCDR